MSDLTNAPDDIDQNALVDAVSHLVNQIKKIKIQYQYQSFVLIIIEVFVNFNRKSAFCAVKTQREKNCVQKTTANNSINNGARIHRPPRQLMCYDQWIDHYSTRF